MMSPDDVSLGSLLPHQMHVFPCCVNWSIGSVCVWGGGREGCNEFKTLTIEQR